MTLQLDPSAIKKLPCHQVGNDAFGVNITKKLLYIYGMHDFVDIL